LRVRIQYEISQVPVYYRNLFMSLLKEALQATPIGQEYFSRLFSFDGNRANKAPKPFCFAVRFLHNRDRFAQTKTTFVLTSPLTLYLSTPDPALLITLYNGLISPRIYPCKWKEVELKRPRSVVLLPEKPIRSEAVVCRTLSPILVEDKHGKPLLPPFKAGARNGESQRFLRELNYLADKVLQGVRGWGLQKELDFRPVALRKEVVKHLVREKGETQRLYTFTCFAGRFVLRGHPEDLEWIQQLGLGLRRAQGFGMVEVI